MTITRQPHDPELGAALEVLLESMPSATIDMGTVTALREETASPLPAIEPETLESMGIVRTDLTIPVYDAPRRRRRSSGAPTTPGRARGSTTSTAVG